jgi:hypothetical protein
VCDVEIILLTNQYDRKLKMTVLQTWRKTVSIVVDDKTRQLNLCRYDKKQNRWIKLLYFSDSEAFDQFINFLGDVADQSDANSPPPDVVEQAIEE